MKNEVDKLQLDIVEKENPASGPEAGGSTSESKDENLKSKSKDEYKESTTLQIVKVIVPASCYISLGAGAWALQYTGPNSKLATIISFYTLAGSELAAFGITINKGIRFTDFFPTIDIITSFIASPLAIGGAIQVATNALVKNGINQTIFPPQDLFTGALSVLGVRELVGSISSYRREYEKGELIKDREIVKAILKAFKSFLFFAAGAGVVIALEWDPNEDVAKYSLLTVAGAAGGLVLSHIAELITNAIIPKKTSEYDQILDGTFDDSLSDDMPKQPASDQELNIQGGSTTPKKLDPPQGVIAGARIFRTSVFYPALAGLSYLLDYIFRHLTKLANECIIKGLGTVQTDSNSTFPFLSNVYVIDINNSTLFNITFNNVPLYLRPADNTFQCNGNTCSGETDNPGMQQSLWTDIGPVGSKDEITMQVVQAVYVNGTYTNTTITCSGKQTAEKVKPLPSSSSISSSFSSSSGSMPGQCTITPDTSTQIVGSTPTAIFRNVGITDITGSCTAIVTHVPSDLQAPSGYSCQGDSCTNPNTTPQEVQASLWDDYMAPPGKVDSLGLEMYNAQTLPCSAEPAVTIERGFGVTPYVDVPTQPMLTDGNPVQTSSAAFASPNILGYAFAAGVSAVGILGYKAVNSIRNYLPQTFFGHHEAVQQVQKNSANIQQFAATSTGLT